MRPSRRMSQEEAEQLLHEGTHGVLSVATKQGEPYGVPLNYFYMPEEQAIYFHCFVKGRKIEYLKENDRVAFVVIGKETVMPERFVTHYDSVMVEGHAEIISDPEEKTKRLIQLCDIFAPGVLERRDEVIRRQLPAVSIVKIHVEKLTGKKNRDD
ncbi:MAG: pyridoxamine 5'-phosphate oxidase family protein [Clostridium sp.]|uniref:pyridoxamine 5'-phosphate oxidase family protein n=1 Tax=Clostridium sp. TaxID=1506 RepID=UPI0029079497|nr:pyridoxamine 5'-phosphate oxidase family protein [Clostridium sp.]MDU7337496.1 pyridoxamine 5'-phosphate oxidase family protein [Clostridium sp.]